MERVILLCTASLHGLHLPEWKLLSAEGPAGPACLSPWPAWPRLPDSLLCSTPSQAGILADLEHSRRSPASARGSVFIHFSDPFSCAHPPLEPLHTCCLLCGESACPPYLKSSLEPLPQPAPPENSCPFSASLPFSIALDTIQHRQCLLCSLFPVSAH